MDGGGKDRWNVPDVGSKEVGKGGLGLLMAEMPCEGLQGSV